MIGFAFFFERIVVYGENSRVLLDLFRSKRMRNKAGEYLGTVKGLIPADNSGRVLYEYHKHTEAFKKRQKLRRFLRKHNISKLTLQRNRKLTDFFGVFVLHK